MNWKCIGVNIKHGTQLASLPPSNTSVCSCLTLLFGCPDHRLLHPQKIGPLMTSRHPRCQGNECLKLEHFQGMLVGLRPHLFQRQNIEGTSRQSQSTWNIKSLAQKCRSANSDNAAVSTVFERVSKQAKYEKIANNGHTSSFPVTIQTEHFSGCPSNCSIFVWQHAFDRRKQSHV